MWDRGIFFQKDRVWFEKNSQFADKWSEVFDLVKSIFSGIQKFPIIVL